jgi:ERF superfamily
VTLADKLHAIQRLAKRVPKRGRHERGWSYVRIEDVVTVATRFMSEHKLILLPNVKSLTRSERGGGSVVDVIVEWRLADTSSVPDPDMLVFDVCGSGFDYDSKGTAKALTDSRKNAMILLFNLKGGDDPERAPMTRTEAKNKQEEVVETKLTDAKEGRGINASVPQIFYERHEQSGNVGLTGDKELLKHAAIKRFKVGREFAVPFDKWELLKEKLESEGITVSKLRA